MAEKNAKSAEAPDEVHKHQDGKQEEPYTLIDKRTGELRHRSSLVPPEERPEQEIRPVSDAADLCTPEDAGACSGVTACDESVAVEVATMSPSAAGTKASNLKSRRDSGSTFAFRGRKRKLHHVAAKSLSRSRVLGDDLLKLRSDFDRSAVMAATTIASLQVEIDELRSVDRGVPNRATDSTEEESACSNLLCVLEAAVRDLAWVVAAQGQQLKQQRDALLRIYSGEGAFGAVIPTSDDVASLHAVEVRTADSRIDGGYMLSPDSVVADAARQLAQLRVREERRRPKRQCGTSDGRGASIVDLGERSVFIAQRASSAYRQSPRTALCLDGVHQEVKEWRRTRSRLQQGLSPRPVTMPCVPAC